MRGAAGATENHGLATTSWRLARDVERVEFKKEADNE